MRIEIPGRLFYVVSRIIEERRTTVRARDVEAVHEQVLFEGREPDQGESPMQRQASA